jgi:uncharacterized protein (DUF1800 family)
MSVRPSPLVEHLLRRAGFGASPAERAVYANLSYHDAVERLLNYDARAADVDALIGTPGYVGVTLRGPFSPNTVIDDSRQRWLFRMVHSPAPLQEKMALFWHNHFATGYTKIAGIQGSSDGARMMAAKPSQDPGKALGQIELFRQFALGNFRDLLVRVAKDPAMLVWLDGITNTKTNPQENFGRELMELFTSGVGNYVETDVYAAARVFTGWNMARTGITGAPSAYFGFIYNSAQHETAAKTFSFPIYPDGSKTIPSRTAASGIQDGLDLINALAIRPETARRMAAKMWTFFVSEVTAPDPDFIDAISQVYLLNDTNMKAVVRAVFYSPQFMDEANFFKRYAWPAEFVTRALKEVGYLGFSVFNALAPMVSMGQQLFEPPDVAGWDLGTTWFSTGGMLARMNFAATLATNQKFALREQARGFKAAPDVLVAFALDQMTVPPLDLAEQLALIDYVRAGGTWTGSETQLLNKSGGLFHLLAGSGEYQFV